MNLFCHILYYSILAVARSLIYIAVRFGAALLMSAGFVSLLRVLANLLRSLDVDVDIAHNLLDFCGGTRYVVFGLAVILWLFLLYIGIMPCVKFARKRPRNSSTADRRYLDDLPLRGGDEDILGRKAFEDKLLRLIDDAETGEGAQYIGLWGRWGIGKTSCMNRIEDRAKKRGLWQSPIFIHFNLLQYSGRDDLLGALFDAIAASNWIKFYGVSGISGALGSKMVANRLLKAPAIRHWCYEAFRFLIYVFSRQEHIQECLAEKLSKIKRRIVVVVDDLERLPQDEVCAVMRMLKSVGNLPYVTYVILASEPHLAVAVGGMMPKVGDKLIDAGREYLGKMVPHSVELLDITNKDVLERYLDREIARFARHYWYKFDAENTSLYFARKMVDTVRDVKRLVNAIHSALEEQRIKNDDVGVSINLEDIVILQAVRLRWPDFYDALPGMYGFFLRKGSDVCTDEMMDANYFNLVPRRDLATAQLFMAEYLGIKRQHKATDPTAGRQYFWDIENPENYKLYEEYRLASAYCFDNYFTTQFPRKMVSKIQLDTAYEGVLANDVEKLSTLMLEVDKNKSLSELLFLLERKYASGEFEKIWTILRALARISDKNLISSSARYGLSAKSVSVYSNIIRHARHYLICIVETEQSALSRLVAEEDTFVLFAGLISDDIKENFKNYIEGQPKEPFRLCTVHDMRNIAVAIRDRIGKKMSNGSFVDMSWAWAALMQINDVICLLGVNDGGLSKYKAGLFDFIPSIEIIVNCNERGEHLERTLRAIVLSIDAYSGAVRSKIHVVAKTGGDNLIAMVNQFKSRWPELDMVVDEEITDFKYKWVVFVRSGDLVGREWFSVLACESYHMSLDIVSYNFYTHFFESTESNKMAAVNAPANLQQYMERIIDLNHAACCFWNKMYKSDMLSEGINLPEWDGYDNSITIGLLLKSKRIKHIDNYLLSHYRGLGDLFKLSLRSVAGLNQSALASLWNMKCLKDTEYSSKAFSAMIERLRKPPSWNALCKLTGGPYRADEFCAKSPHILRIKFWLCGKMPYLSWLIFPSVKKMSRKAA